MNMNNCIFVTGRLTKDVVLSQTQGGTAYCNLVIAVDRPYRADKERATDFIGCTAWGKTAEFISRNFAKGSAIKVQGDLRNRNYTDKNGNAQYSYSVNVNSVDFPISNTKKETGSEHVADIPPVDEAPYDIGDFDPSGYEQM